MNIATFLDVSRCYMEVKKVASIKENQENAYEIVVNIKGIVIHLANPFREYDYKPFIKKRSGKPPSKEYPVMLQIDTGYSQYESDPPAESPYYLYGNGIYQFDKADYTSQQRLLLILDYEKREREKWERLANVMLLKTNTNIPRRERIPEEVRIVVWRRDGGRCVKCGSREKLEYDHIVPLSKGGSNTARNIELLCESCNRKKSNSIG